MGTSGTGKKKLSKQGKIILAVLAAAAAVFLLWCGVIVYSAWNDPEAAAVSERIRKLEDIAYYTDDGRFYAYVDDPGTLEFEFAEDRCTEVMEESRVDFGGYHFVTAAGHDAGTGYAVIVSRKEGSGEPAYYAVFRLRMKDHRITEVTDAQTVKELNDFVFLRDR